MAAISELFMASHHKKVKTKKKHIFGQSFRHQPLSSHV